MLVYIRMFFKILQCCRMVLFTECRMIQPLFEVINYILVKTNFFSASFLEYI